MGTLAVAVLFSVSVQMLPHGEASKLSGKLQWSSQSAFRNVGRAMLRPLIEHKRARKPDIGLELQLALQWWEEVLQLQIRCVREAVQRGAVLRFLHARPPAREMRAWEGNAGRQLHMFADARSKPPRIAAVLFRHGAGMRVSSLCATMLLCFVRDGRVCYCDAPVPEHLMASFRVRADGQIMGLEILAIALGACR